MPRVASILEREDWMVESILESGTGASASQEAGEGEELLALAARACGWVGGVGGCGCELIYLYEVIERELSGYYDFIGLIVIV
jgi:hypothetical protein